MSITINTRINVFLTKMILSHNEEVINAHTVRELLKDDRVEFYMIYYDVYSKLDEDTNSEDTDCVVTPRLYMMLQIKTGVPLTGMYGMIESTGFDWTIHRRHNNTELDKKFINMMINSLDLIAEFRFVKEHILIDGVFITSEYPDELPLPLMIKLHANLSSVFHNYIPHQHLSLSHNE